MKAITSTEYKKIFAEIKERIRKAQYDAFKAVNKKYEKPLRAGNLAKLLAPAEQDAASGRTRPARDFLKEFREES